MLCYRRLSMYTLMAYNLQHSSCKVVGGMYDWMVSTAVLNRLCLLLQIRLQMGYGDVVSVTSCYHIPMRRWVCDLYSLGWEVMKCVTCPTIHLQTDSWISEYLFHFRCLNAYLTSGKVYYVGDYGCWIRTFPPLGDHICFLSELREHRPTVYISMEHDMKMQVEV